MEKQLLPGMFDIVPEDPKELWRSSHLWQALEENIRALCKVYGYEEIRTPVLEKTSLFLRTSGEDSDVVSKELYEFTDKGDRSISLRPEGTASVMRAFMEQPQEWQKAHHKFYYIESMFRYDRPQAGRYRQHHQFGLENIGVKSPESDAEVIDLLYTLYLKLGIENVELQINSLGTPASRKAFIEALQTYYEPHQSKLSADSQRRLSQNPLRILDSKEPQDIAINQDAPSILDHLDTESNDHFYQLQHWLTKLGIPFKINSRLVRGLDYYNHTVFEFVVGTIGSQNSIGGGGRYDGLLKKMGGPDLPALGFGTGLERIFQTILSQDRALALAPKISLYLIPLGPEATEKAFSLAREARRNDIICEVDLSRRKIGKMMDLAHAKGAKYTAVIGETEIKENTLSLKEMEKGEETKLKFSDVINHILFHQSLPGIFAEIERAYSILNNPQISERFLSSLDEQIQKTGESLRAIQNQVIEIKNTLY